jgi:hypothetical protein
MEKKWFWVIVIIVAVVLLILAFNTNSIFSSFGGDVGLSPDFGRSDYVPQYSVDGVCCLSNVGQSSCKEISNIQCIAFGGYWIDEVDSCKGDPCRDLTGRCGYCGSGDCTGLGEYNSCDFEGEPGECRLTYQLCDPEDSSRGVRCICL